MDIQYSDQDLAFREEVRTFLSENFSDELATRIASAKTLREATVEWQKKLHAKGWIAPGWPVEYGGTGWTPTQAFIYEQERSALGIPDNVPFGLNMVGPVIYTFGNEEQKERFLPKILSSDDWWCQGYSEPGAGSDLAAIQTKAQRDGDNYIVNGQKVWTTYAQYADWIFCLVRTDNSGRKQAGISFLLIDMKSEGITVREIPSIDNNHTLNEVFFENVKVPIKNLIGEENGGWTYAKALLAHERTTIAGVAQSKRYLEKIKQVASAEINGGKALIDDPIFQSRISRIEIELMALEYSELRIFSSMAAGDNPGAISSMLKIKGTEIQQAAQELLMDVAGPFQGVIAADTNLDEIGHAFGSDARKTYMYGRAATIYGGSNEVQRNVMAKAVLGL